ncbi:MAG TPA: PhzF family phenazine biosynthesis protein [Sphingomicrobium sp.]|nr:PhzF family phenazine biosynthesis protein [Sphingomicrobium sp.]
MTVTRYRFQLLDVFTEVPFGGNQLAVFPEASGLTTAQMQKIAREMNLSECAFAFPCEGKKLEWTLRIFTPGVENPFAGHPTIGGAIALAGEAAGPEQRTRIVLHEQIGPIAVEVEGNGRSTSARLTLPNLPQFGPADHSVDELAAMLGIEASEIGEGAWAPATVSCGIPYYIIPVKSLDVARRCSLRLDRWERLLASHWAPHVYLIAPETLRRDADFHVRMFPPAMSVAEDPATGSAAAAFAGLLARIDGGSGRRRWSVEQGIELGRPSFIVIHAELEEGVATSVSIVGEAIVVGDGHIRAPSE